MPGNIERVTLRSVAVGRDAAKYCFRGFRWLVCLSIFLKALGRAFIGADGADDGIFRLHCAYKVSGGGSIAGRAKMEGRRGSHSELLETDRGVEMHGNVALGLVGFRASWTTRLCSHCTD